MLEELSDTKQALIQEQNDQQSETYQPRLLMPNKNKQNLIQKIRNLR
jgi:hypothetical protein